MKQITVTWRLPNTTRDDTRMYRVKRAVVWMDTNEINLILDQGKNLLERHRN